MNQQKGEDIKKVYTKVKPNFDKQRQKIYEQTDQLLAQYYNDLFQSLDKQQNERFFKLKYECPADLQTQNQQVGDLEQGITQEFKQFNQESKKFNANQIIISQQLLMNKNIFNEIEQIANLKT